jgi:hypothetical protein
MPATCQLTSPKLTVYGKQDTSIVVNGHQAMLINMTFNRMLYLEKDRNFLLKKDSLNTSIISDQGKAILLLKDNNNSLTYLNTQITKDLEAANVEIGKQTRRKKAWKVATIAGIPISFLGGILLILL